MPHKSILTTPALACYHTSIPDLISLLCSCAGYYVKSVQLLAAKGDFMPEPWTRRLSVMFDRMPPRSWGPTRQVSRHIISYFIVF